MAISPTPPGKAEGAFRTIGELSKETGLPQHILRYWETRFPQLRPLQRAGNRRYYRPQDVVLVQRIARMLNDEGYTIRGVQQALMADRKRAPTTPLPPASYGTILAVREALVEALEQDALA